MGKGAKIMDVGAINVLSVGLTYFGKNENQKLKLESNFFLNSDFCSRNENLQNTF